MTGHGIEPREEKDLLASSRRPIVLLEEKETSSISPMVAEGLRHQGMFLPYTPLHHLLMREVGFPLVMTSGNLSSEPIAKDNHEALERLGDIADCFLLHDRDILVRYDDSVTRGFKEREYPIRRARGYAPYPVKLEKDYPVEVLALGAEQKNTFSFLRGRHAFVGQHIGDMDTREASQHYREAMEALPGDEPQRRPGHGALGRPVLQLNVVAPVKQLVLYLFDLSHGSPLGCLFALLNAKVPPAPNRRSWRSCFRPLSHPVSGILCRKSTSGTCESFSPRPR